MLDSAFTRSRQHKYVGVLGDLGPQAPPLLNQMAQFLLNTNHLVTAQSDETGQISQLIHDTPDGLYHFVKIQRPTDFLQRLIDGLPTLDAAVIMVPPKSSSDKQAKDFSELCRYSGVTKVLGVRSSRSKSTLDAAPVMAANLNSQSDVLEIITEIEKLMANDNSSVDPSFMMKVQDFTHTEDLAPVVTGTVNQGSISTGEKVELIDSEGIQLATIQEITSGPLQLEQARVKETVSLRLGDILAVQIRPGHIVVKPDKLKLTKAVEINGYLPRLVDAKTVELLKGDTQICLRFPHTTVFGTIAENTSEQNTTKLVKPGQPFNMTVQLTSLIPLADHAVCVVEFSINSFAVGTAQPLKVAAESIELYEFEEKFNAYDPFQGMAKFVYPEPLRRMDISETFEVSATDDEKEMDQPVTFELRYGTNRIPINPNDASEGFLNSIDPEMLHTGTCLVNIPKSHQFGSIGSGFFKRILKGNRDHPLKLMGIKPSKSNDAFTTALRDALNNDEKYVENRVLVYIHGYNNSFEDAAIRAAQIGFDLKYPGVTAFYSWPSHNQKPLYPADTQRAMASEPKLVEFLQLIQQKAGAERVDLIIHSMGNQVFARSIQLMLCAAETRGIRLGTVILAAPDIDVHLFRQIAPRYLDAAKNVTMYVSLKDLALLASLGLQLSQRAGFGLPITVVPKIPTIEVSRIDFSLLGHGYYAEAHSVLRDMMKLLSDQNPDNPSKRDDLREMSTPNGERYWEFIA